MIDLSDTSQRHVTSRFKKKTKVWLIVSFRRPARFKENIYSKYIYINTFLVSFEQSLAFR